MSKYALTAMFLLVACGEGVEPSMDVSSIEGKSPQAHVCESSMFQPTSTILSCCQDGNHAWYVATGPSEPAPSLWFRHIGPPCTLEDGNTQCGFGTGIPCFHGPCGGGSVKAVKAASVAVFVPESKPEQCGWQASGITGCISGCDFTPDKEVRFHPEPYVAQTHYPAVAGTCPFRACFAGRPCVNADCSDQR